MFSRSKVVLLFILSILITANLYAVLYCNANNVNIRSEPNAESDILGQFSINDAISPTGEKGNWYEILYKDDTAWVYKTFFSESEIEQKIEQGKYWLNTNSNKLHNSSCRWYGNTKKGYYTDEAPGSDCGICKGAHRAVEKKVAPTSSGNKYWINTNSNVRHNSSCRWYGNTKQGYFTDQKVGKACGICGG